MLIILQNTEKHGNKQKMNQKQFIQLNVIKANNFFRNKEYKEALKIYEKILFIDKNNLDCYLNLGEIYFNKCDFSVYFNIFFRMQLFVGEKY